MEGGMKGEKVRMEKMRPKGEGRFVYRRAFESNREELADGV